VIRFRLLGIPVRVHPLFWVLALVLGIGGLTGWELAVWVGVVFVSVLIHELGHALTAVAYGQDPAVTLHAFGGMTTFVPGPDHGPGRAVAVTLAGPLAGFAFAGLSWVAYHFTGLGDGPDPVRLALVALMWVNLVWGVFNLIPIRGLDGGQAMAGIVTIVAPARARWITETVYVVVGVAAAVYGFVAGYPILALVAILFTFGGWFRDPAEPPATGPEEGAAPRPRPEEPELPL